MSTSSLPAVQPAAEEPVSIERIRDEVHEAAEQPPHGPPPTAVAAPADPPPPPTRLTDEECAEFLAVIETFRRAQQSAQETEQRAIQAAGEMRDAAAVVNHVRGRIGAKYALLDGDRIEDDGAIIRAAHAE
jgi:hypothetical protein